MFMYITRYVCDRGRWRLRVQRTTWHENCVIKNRDLDLQRGETVMALAFFDIEASGLDSDSYPIELGWAIPIDDTCIDVDSTLIRPLPHWQFWSADAEAIHKIPRRRLETDGCDAVEAARRAEAALSGHTVYSDNPEYDGFWLDRLYQDVGLERRFKLLSLLDLFFALPGVQPDMIRDAARDASDRAPFTHRAGQDARHHAVVYALLQQRVRRTA